MLVVIKKKVLTPEAEITMGRKYKIQRRRLALDFQRPPFIHIEYFGISLKDKSMFSFYGNEIEKLE